MNELLMEYHRLLIISTEMAEHIERVYVDVDVESNEEYCMYCRRKSGENYLIIHVDDCIVPKAQSFLEKVRG